MTNKSHIINGEFQSDKYPWCKPGFVPLKLTDPMALQCLRAYAKKRHVVDEEFANDLDECLDEIYNYKVKVVSVDPKRFLDMDDTHVPGGDNCLKVNTSLADTGAMMFEEKWRGKEMWNTGWKYYLQPIKFARMDGTIAFYDTAENYHTDLDGWIEYTPLLSNAIKFARWAEGKRIATHNGSAGIQFKELCFQQIGWFIDSDDKLITIGEISEWIDVTTIDDLRLKDEDFTSVSQEYEKTKPNPKGKIGDMFFEWTAQTVDAQWVRDKSWMVDERVFIVSIGSDCIYVVSSGFVNCIYYFRLLKDYETWPELKTCGRKIG